ncbi:rDNA origin-binding protein (macronuclear) [Tetrahymena thermophila SB210]|uniref:rDNA origin-binding protein n=2 Tax=Tetrahymena thermophila TaxID=5911 RepID=Q23DA9_TETTS|nr:rDNA origin-binding protein [Tetrahymena thermophila SB210]AAL09694.1 rDNA origin binding protein [Tetrahymena thermophila]EAR94355.2 rDNA origin-binding protein [Tetrahymena thermophila SB210]|eukprot:XP_001014777.2 rDNA origin-binding protein [Tetrahymena thermophila SB210]
MFSYFKGLVTKKTQLFFQPNNQFSEIWKKKKNIIIKPFSIISGETVFSATPIKGKYGVKNDYITVLKNGCMLTEVIPCSKDNTGKVNIDYSKRLNFAMSLSNMGQILAISDELISKSTINTKIEYTLSSDVKKKALYISKKPEDTHLNIQIKESNLLPDQNKWADHLLQANVSVPDFIIFRELCRFSLPYMIGWQALASYDFAEKDSSDDRL